MEEQNHKPHPLATRKRPVLGRIKTINLENFIEKTNKHERLPTNENHI